MFRHFSCPWCNEDLPLSSGRQAVKMHLVKCIMVAQRMSEDPLQLQLEASPEVSTEEE